MEGINTLTVRNKLGEVLDRLEKTGEPILISKVGKIKAVLLTPEVRKTVPGLWLTFDQKAHWAIQGENISIFLEKGLPPNWPDGRRP
jgi:prevent-host-death family protein